MYKVQPYGNVAGNPLVCDCEMKWYKRWWMGDWQKIDTDHIKEIKCLDPEDNTEHIMKDVEIEHFFCESPTEESQTTSKAAAGSTVALVVASMVVASMACWTGP